MASSRDDSSQRPPFADIDRLIHEPARFLAMAQLYVVEAADFVFLQRQTNLTWGNLSSHISKLEDAGYVHVEKSFKAKKPHTMLRWTEEGRKAFRDYRDRMQETLSALPE